MIDMRPALAADSPPYRGQGSDRPDEGPRLWRGLDEIGGSTLPQRSGSIPDAAVAGGGLSRRAFLQYAGASLALAGAGGCSRAPEETILPYVEAPEGLVADQPLFYASALPLDGYARGVLVKTTMGRPIKVEGNPKHPASLGGTDVYAQAAVLDLWDPDRSRSLLHQGQPATWEALVADLGEHRRTLEGAGGRGLAILTDTVTSPTLASQITRLLERWPHARWYHPAPSGEAAALRASAAAFGTALTPRIHLDRATVVLALDADPLGPGPEQVMHAAAFAKARDPASATFLRLYAAEPTPSLTGAMADHRLPTRAAWIQILAWQLAYRLGLDVPEPPPDDLPDGWKGWRTTSVRPAAVRWCLSARGNRKRFIVSPRPSMPVSAPSARR